jgi:hypothetical protein
MTPVLRSAPGIPAHDGSQGFNGHVQTEFRTAKRLVAISCDA